ncbi:MAG: hypothetical protein ACPG5U_08075 [Planktomarina sp.]
MRIVLLAILTLTAACRYDKEAHYAIGLASANYVTERTGSALQGCAASIGLGLIKEAADRQFGGNVERADILATSAGCQFGVRW